MNSASYYYVDDEDVASQRVAESLGGTGTIRMHCFQKRSERVHALCEHRRVLDTAPPWRRWRWPKQADPNHHRVRSASNPIIAVSTCDCRDK